MDGFEQLLYNLTLTCPAPDANAAKNHKVKVEPLVTEIRDKGEWLSPVLLENATVKTFLELYNAAQHKTVAWSVNTLINRKGIEDRAFVLAFDLSRVS